MAHEPLNGAHRFRLENQSLPQNKHRGSGHVAPSTSPAATTSVTFPRKLMAILSEMDRSTGKPKFESIVHWTSDGKAFKVENRCSFSSEVLPLYFNGNEIEFRSFTRRLLRWGFKRIVKKGNQCHGAFFHELFRRDKPELCSEIKTKEQINHSCKMEGFECTEKKASQLAESGRNGDKATKLLTKQETSAIASMLYLSHGEDTKKKRSEPGHQHEDTRQGNSNVGRKQKKHSAILPASQEADNTEDMRRKKLKKIYVGTAFSKDAEGPEPATHKQKSSSSTKILANRKSVLQPRPICNTSDRLAFDGGKRFSSWDGSNARDLSTLAPAILAGQKIPAKSAVTEALIDGVHHDHEQQSLRQESSVKTGRDGCKNVFRTNQQNHEEQIVLSSHGTLVHNQTQRNRDGKIEGTLYQRSCNPFEPGNLQSTRSTYYYPVYGPFAPGPNVNRPMILQRALMLAESFGEKAFNSEAPCIVEASRLQQLQSAEQEGRFLLQALYAIPPQNHAHVRKFGGLPTITDFLSPESQRLLLELEQNKHLNGNSSMLLYPKRFTEERTIAMPGHQNTAEGQHSSKHE